MSAEKGDHEWQRRVTMSAEKGDESRERVTMSVEKGAEKGGHECREGWP